MDSIVINAAITSAKAVAITLQAIAKLKLDHQTLVRVNEALQQVADIQQQLFNTNQQLFELQKERDELQRQLKSTAEWEVEKARYKMVETPAGTILWESVDGSPQHYACPVCFADKKVLPLSKHGEYALRCPLCNKTYQREKPPPMTPMQRRAIRFGPGSW
jgi:rubredoxin